MLILKGFAKIANTYICLWNMCQVDKCSHTSETKYPLNHIKRRNNQPMKILYRPNNTHFWISTQQGHNLSRFEARKHPTRQRWIHQTHWFWLLQKNLKQNIYFMWDARIFGTRGIIEQGAWKASGLVDFRNTYLWDDSRNWPF